MRWVVFAVAAVVLAGCSTTTPAERLATNQAGCASYGFKPGTDAYASCMMQLDLSDQQAERERRQRIGAAISEMGRQPQVVVQPAYIQPPRLGPRTVQCNTQPTGFGYTGASQTTCTQY